MDMTRCERQVEPEASKFGSTTSYPAMARRGRGGNHLRRNCDCEGEGGTMVIKEKDGATQNGVDKATENGAEGVRFQDFVGIADSCDTCRGRGRRKEMFSRIGREREVWREHFH